MAEQEKRVRITLDESDGIPPTGQFVQLNGRAYMIKPGEPVDVPRGVVEILDHAVMKVPLQDPTSRRIIDWRDRKRFPYSVR